MMNSSTHLELVAFGQSSGTSWLVRSAKPFAILAAAAITLTQADVVLGQTAAMRSNGVSAPTQQLPPRVERFCRDVDSLPKPETTLDAQANQFARKLRDALLNNKPMPPVTASDLSVEAAKKLSSFFHEDITAAMAHSEVIAPPAVLITFLQGVRGEELWRRIPLITKHALIPRPLTDVPEVIVTTMQRDKLNRALAEPVFRARRVGELRYAYKVVYRGHPGWFKAIAPYFVEQPDEDE